MLFQTVREVKVVDVNKRRSPSKHYVYLLSVKYADCRCHTIYRRYSQFFDLQMQILDRFPIEAGQKDPKERLIPFLPGKLLFRRSRIREVATKRLRHLDNYCQALLRLPTHISQCEEVLKFFDTKAEDMNPPKENCSSVKHKSGRDAARAQKDECDSVFVVTANYQRQERTEVSLTAGERVQVIEKSESGWWFVSTADEQGWVPATYLVSPSGKRDGLKTCSSGEEERYMTMQAYSSSNKEEMSFESGVTVEVIQKNLEGWWFIRHEGKEGWAPASYLRKVEDDVSGAEQAVAAETSKVEIIGNLMEISNLLNKRPGGERHSPPDTLRTTDASSMGERDSIDAPHTFTDDDTELDFISDPESDTDEFFINTEPKRDSFNDTSAGETQTAGTGLKAGTGPSSTSKGPNTAINGEANPSNNRDSNIAASRDATKDANITASRDANSAGSDRSSETANKAASAHSSTTPRGKTVPASPAIARVAPQRYHSVENDSSTLRQKPPPRRENSLGFQLPQPPEPPSVEAEYYTIAEFHSCLGDGISFRGGQKAEVREKNSGGWWYVQIGEKEGWAPCSYIDKRKKPTVNRRTGTLTRPKVPPPAPPTKKQDSREAPAPPHPGAEISGGPSRPVYEEPEYDVPSVGLDLEPELEFLAGDSSSKDSPSSSLHSASFTTGEEEERWADEEEECIYENDGFRPIAESSEPNWDSNSPRRANSRKGPSFYGGKEGPRKGGKSEPPLSDPPRYKPKQHRAKQAEGSGSKPKPSVRPKPALTRSPSLDPDFSSLRRQLKPAGQTNRVRPRSSREEDSETASIASSQDSLGSHSTSTDRSSASKSSRGGDGEVQSSMYRTSAAYQRAEASEVSFPAGVEVQVLEKQESGWWFIRFGQEEGWAPTYYLQPARQPDHEPPRRGESEAGRQPNGAAASEAESEAGRSQISKSSSLEKNEQRVQTLNNLNQNQSLGGTSSGSISLSGANKPSDQQHLQLHNQQKRDGVKQVAVRPQSVLTPSPVNVDTANSTSSLRRNGSLTPQDLSSGGGVKNISTRNPTSLTSSFSFRRKVPVSMVKPKPHLIHNNLRDEYVTIADYHGDEDTMGFPAGTRLEVLERNPNGWWYCRVLDAAGGSRKGWVPSNFLERRN